MVGAGIYALIGNIVETAGAWAPAMFMLASVVMLLNGFALAGIVRRFPHAGSILSVVEETMHPRAAIVFEVLRLVEGGLALCVTSKLTTKFLVGLAQGPHVEPHFAAEAAMLIAVAFIVHRGFESAMDFGNCGTCIEVFGLVLVIVAAVAAPATPCAVLLPDLGLHNGAMSVTKIVFAFGGVQGLLDMAGDVQDVENVLPKVVIASITATGLLYTCVCYAAITMVGVDGLTKKSISPLGMALENVGFPIGTEVALVLVSLVSVGNTCVAIFTFVSRIACSLANRVTAGPRVSPPAMYAAMTVGAGLTGRMFDVFNLAERVGVMLLVTFAVLDYAFVASIAQTRAEMCIGSLALVTSCALVVVDRFA